MPTPIALKRSAAHGPHRAGLPSSALHMVLDNVARAIVAVTIRRRPADRAAIVQELNVRALRRFVRALRPFLRHLDETVPLLVGTTSLVGACSSVSYCWSIGRPDA